MNQLSFTVALVPALIFSSAVFAQTRIRIRKDAAPRINVAVCLLENRGAGGDNLAREMTNVLADDLLISGFFTPLPNNAFVQEAIENDRRTGTTNLKEWAALGAEVVVKGNYALSGDRITVDCGAISVGKAQQVYSRKFANVQNKWPDTIHTIADEIVEALTGEKGLARTEIAFVSSDRGEKKIYLMDASGHNWRQINSGRGMALSPDWSPDGAKLVYTSYASGYPWAILDDLSSGERAVLSSQPGLNAFPAVSPNGKWVALTLSKDGNNEIYKITIDGKKPARLTYGSANDCSPAWSPDGNEIAFTSDRRGTPQIYIMDADGDNVRRLTTRGAYNASPAWSPRGNLIAYTSQIEGNFEICAIDVSTGETTQLTRNWGSDEEPAWAPDGRHLVYSSRQGGTTNLYTIDIQNPEPVRITSGKDCFGPAWGPYKK
jgi:TolB protein